MDRLNPGSREVFPKIPIRGYKDSLRFNRKPNDMHVIPAANWNSIFPIKEW